MIADMLGDCADVIERVRSTAERQPIEHSEVQRWFDKLSIPAELRPEHAIWQRGFDQYYFDQLRRRAIKWFLFRHEFLLVLSTGIVSETPMPGHASYVFARPADLEAFMATYAKTTRDDIRYNRGNKAVELGFVGRVVRGCRKKVWLAAVLRRLGENTGTGSHPAS